MDNIHLFKIGLENDKSRKLLLKVGQQTKKIMKKLSVILFAILGLLVSCSSDIDDLGKDDVGSFTMVYDGVTYEGAEAASLSLVQGIISVKGTEGEGFLLTIMGVGEDGSIVEICTEEEDCETDTYISLDFGAVEGKEGAVFTKGTIERDGKTIKLEATGINFSAEETEISATIVVNSVIEF